MLCQCLEPELLGGGAQQVGEGGTSRRTASPGGRGLRAWCARRRVCARQPKFYRFDALVPSRLWAALNPNFVLANIEEKQLGIAREQPC